MSHSRDSSTTAIDVSAITSDALHRLQCRDSEYRPTYAYVVHGASVLAN